MQKGERERERARERFEQVGEATKDGQQDWKRTHVEGKRVPAIYIS